MFSSHKTSQKPFSTPFFSAIIIITMLWYLSLCLANYFSLRPLWNDEECVLRSLKLFTPARIFNEPLVALQVFPRVYLFLIQKISQPFDFHLLALRFFSFVCMLAAFFVWMKIARYEFKNKIDRLAFALSWCASAVLIYYSAELKQYSMDVLAAALFLLFLYNQERFEKEKPFWLYACTLVSLPVLLLFSYPALFFCFVPLYNLKTGKETR